MPLQLFIDQERIAQAVHDLLLLQVAGGAVLLEC